MAVFAITFRIETDSTYSERYDSLVEQIRKVAIGGLVWDEPTSFSLIESSKTSKDLCDSLYFNSKIIDSKDMVLVVNLSQKGYGQYGAKYPNTLDSLMQKR